MLPIQSVYPSLLEKLQNYNSVVLQAPPGAGKSTWLPLNLLKEGIFKRIVMLEPRRIAALSIANYLAQCLNEEVGQQVGYRMRGDSRVSNQTRLEIVTEGILCRMLQSDPFLSDVDLIIFDEFHERSLAADTALALALESQQGLRDDLTLLVMSATLNGELLTEFLDAPLVSCEGRSFDVAEHYIAINTERDWLKQIPSTILSALHTHDGSILVFLPGQKEISQVAEALTNKLPNNTQVMPLLGNMSKQAQQAAIAPALAGTRKIVLATNIAETSLTIDGISVVIDSGKQRVSRFNLNNGVSQLVTETISKSSAIQRAGRAGRTQAGVVYRLASKEQFERAQPHDLPEILTADISQLVLEALNWGSDVNSLMLLDKPSKAQINQAYSLLTMLEAVDENQKITKLGQAMLALGTDLRFAHLVIKAKALEAHYPGIELLSIYLVALLESGRAQSLQLEHSLQTQLHQPSLGFTQALNYWLKKCGLRKPRELAIEWLPICVALCYPDRLAKVRGQGAIMANGAGVTLSDDVLLGNDYLAIASVGGQTGRQVFSATKLPLALIEQALPHLFSKQKVTEYDQKTEKFIAQMQTRLGAIVIKHSPLSESISAEQKQAAWQQIIIKNGLQLFKLSELQTQLWVRLQLAHKLFPEQFSAVDESTLLAQLTTWLGSYLGSINSLSELKQLDIINCLYQSYDWQQQQLLASLFPERIAVPTGSNIRVLYQLDGPAKLAVKIQEVYGLLESPVLANGKLTVQMELLSPAMRSLQITQDLAYFWANSYKEVQKEMKGRYPKHFWPDDPANSAPTRRVKSKM